MQNMQITVSLTHTLNEYNDSDNVCVKETVVDAKYANYKRGDINLDGIINTSDLSLLSKYLKKQAILNNVQINVADYNNNGAIDNNDLYELEDYLKTEVEKVNTLGDINSDNIIDSNDVILLDKYVLKKVTLTKRQLNYADINGDGLIDATDVDELAKTISDYYQVGDINLDGKIDIIDVSMLQNMFNGVVIASKVQLNLCDVNEDGVIDNNDVISLRNKVGTITKYPKGDVNLDGKVTREDVTIIENYILKKTELTIDQLNYADYNGDSVIDNKDANSLAKAVSSKYNIGDINMDGKVSMIDINLLNKYISKLIDLDTTQKLLADINGDGIINANDLKR